MLPRIMPRKPGDMNVRILVISVRSFKARHQHIEAQAEKFGFDFSYIFDFDADQLNNAPFRFSPDLRPESASNVLKHMEAQRLASLGDEEVVLVLEDDVILFPDFFEKLDIVISQASDLPPGWLIFLGGADNKLSKEALACNSVSLVAAPITTAEAYLVDRSSCEKRIKWLCSFELDRQADHQLKLIDAEVGIQQYRISHPIAAQGSITGKFETSLDASRSKRSALFLMVKYLFNRCRRQLFPRACNSVSRWF